MNDDFFKFPSTPHLCLLGDVKIRDDKVFSDYEKYEFLRHELIVEEKIDGANLGISFDSEGNILLQSRGAYLQGPLSGQWRKLYEWIDLKLDALFEHLTDRYIMFGEWCYAQHSVVYNRLPDLFLGFDILDKYTEDFFSFDRREEFLQLIGICSVPFINKGHYSLTELNSLLSQSKLGEEPAEGLYLRIDQGDWLKQRAKLVRPVFIQSIEQHWSSKPVRPNSLLSEKVE